MHLKAATLDDLLRLVFGRLLKSKNRNKATRGETREEFGALLELADPRARLSRTENKQQTLFSCLGELLWYLAGSDELEFICYYVPAYERDSVDKTTIRSAYGPRLFGRNGVNQIQNVLRQLKKNDGGSRRAVIQLFEADDSNVDHHEAPCTCTIQFVVRSNRLHMLTFMRSNDVFLGLPHDIFAFTMLQEIIAASLGKELGVYKHAVGSLHLYDDDRRSARKYLKEAWQSTLPMPPMPLTDPWKALETLRLLEREFREGRHVDVNGLDLAPYWADLARLLEIFARFRADSRDKIPAIKAQMTSRIYDTYIDKKIATPRKGDAFRPPQMRFSF